MTNVLKRHALLFSIALGAVVLIVLIVLLRQKNANSAASAANGATTGSGTVPGDAGLTAGYGPAVTENITNVYGQQPTTSGGTGGTPGPSSGPSSGPTGPATPMRTENPGGLPGQVVKPIGPIHGQPIIAPPAASGAPTINSGSVYSGSAGRVAAETSHTPVRLPMVLANAGGASRGAAASAPSTQIRHAGTTLRPAAPAPIRRTGFSPLAPRHAATPAPISAARPGQALSLSRSFGG